MRAKALLPVAEAGDPEAVREFWELAGAMQVKLAIHRGMIKPGEHREG